MTCQRSRIRQTSHFLHASYCSRIAAFDAKRTARLAATRRPRRNTGAFVQATAFFAGPLKPFGRHASLMEIKLIPQQYRPLTRCATAGAVSIFLDRMVGQTRGTLFVPRPQARGIGERAIIAVWPSAEIDSRQKAARYRRGAGPSARRRDGENTLSPRRGCRRYLVSSCTSLA